MEICLGRSALPDTRQGIGCRERRAAVPLFDWRRHAGRHLHGVTSHSGRDVTSHSLSWAAETVRGGSASGGGGNGH